MTFCARALNGEADEAQHGGLPGRVQRGQGAELPVGGHGVLREVVGSQAGEFHFPKDGLGRQRGRGDLHHHARGFDPGIGAHGGEAGGLFRRGDHRGHDPHVRFGLLLGQGDCFQLAVQHARRGEVRAVAADAQCGVGLGGVGQEGERLVGAGIERPQHHLLAREGIKDALVGCCLFLHGGLGVPFQEAEFGTEQSHPLGAELRGRLGILAAAYVGEERHQVAVRRRARAAELGQQGSCGRPCVRCGTQGLVGLGRDGSGGAVHIDLRAVRELVHAYCGDDGRKAEGAGDDGSVGLGAAACRDERQDLVRVQGGGVGGGQLFDHQDERRVGGGDAGGGHAPQLGDDPCAHVQDVRGALGHVAAQVVKHFRDGGAGLPDGALTRGAAGNELGGTLDQHGVLGHQCRGFQDGLAVTRGVRGAGLQFVVHSLGRRLEGGCRVLGRDAGGQLFACRRLTDGLGHLADGADDPAGADAYSLEVLH
ncbi:hypothetical protein D9M72_339160 [compost metagenome]